MDMDGTPPAVAAERLKDDRNYFLTKGNIGAAITSYTQALMLCPGVAKYWTNRALCHLKRSDWEMVLNDSRRAISVDPSFHKGHYYLGKALVKTGHLEEGAKALEKAHELAINLHRERTNTLDDIWTELAAAKYELWERASSERRWESEQLKKCCEMAITGKKPRDLEASSSDFGVLSTEELLKKLTVVFEKALKSDIPSHLPRHLCCPITLELFRDPVITPSGITYEKDAITMHLKKSKTDPVSRVLLFASRLVPNLVAKEAVRAYLDQYPWAYNIKPTDETW